MPQYSGIFTLSQASQAIKDQNWTGVPPTTLEYLVVAGGGAAWASGGGAGGLLSGTIGVTPGVTYPITVGAGGTITVVSTVPTSVTNGSNSVLGSITALGGGAGAWDVSNNWAQTNGNAGGSGGSGCARNSSPSGNTGTSFGGAGTPGQGNQGGNGYPSGALSDAAAGGGGGAGSPGTNGTAAKGGAGGAGITSSISGIATTYAGGGAGGAYSGTAGVGGVGGGANPGTSAAPNTGGGGGGGYFAAGPGYGGSGIVIVRYPGSTKYYSGGVLSYDSVNNYTVHTFHASGALTPVTPTLYSDPNYQVSRSLRFNSADSAYLSRTFTDAGNRTTWTWSAWVKRATVGSTQDTLFTGGTVGSDTGWLGIYFSNNSIAVGGSATNFIISTPGFRDPSAWYHIVVALDTNQAVATNRLKLYVNGVEVTAFGTDNRSSITLGSSLGVNQAAAHYIGSQTIGSALYLNGYMAEVNFIDGLALNPLAFGFSHPDTGVWTPLRYNGVYGQNGFYLNFSDNSNTTATTLGKDQNLTNLARYSEQFSLWPSQNAITVTDNYATAPNGINNASRIVYTPGSYGQIQQTYSTTAGANATYTFSVWLKSTSGANQTVRLKSTHGGIVDNFSADQTVTSTWQKFTYTLTNTNSAGTGQIVGLREGSANAAFDVLAWGAQLVPSSDTSATYVQTFSSPAGNNNFTPNNFSIASGFGNDSLVESPTSYGTDTGVGGEVRGNYCTLNPLQKSSNVTLTNGNLDCTVGSSDGKVLGTIGMSSGKWYAEVTNIINYPTIGIATGAANIANYTGGDVYSWGYYAANGNKYTNGSPSSYGASFTGSDVVGIAFDADAGTLTYYKNGTSQGTAFTGLTSGPYFFSSGNNSNTGCSWNFGQRSFAYTAPSGFKSLCTQNLPTPTIGTTSTTQARNYFNTVIYTGVGTAQNITGIGFQPDLTWFKCRQGYGHVLTDSVRGVTKQLDTTSTAADQTTSSYITSFLADGYSFGSGDNGINGMGYTYVSWNWKGGGTAVSNTSGTITSTVSANTTSGFSVVTFTADGTTKTVGHGLGVKPSLIIVKVRNGAGSWITMTDIINGSMQYGALNSTAAFASIGYSAPTSTVFQYNDNNGNTQVAYCFAEVAGFSKFGTYTGTNSTDGPFIYTGFRPRYIMAKRSSGIGQWYIYDTARDTYNVAGNELLANATTAEAYTVDLDIVSNGFKQRTTSAANVDGSTYIYMAFAESPFKYARAR